MNGGAIHVNNKDGAGKRAVVLLSGGLDSSTCLAIAVDQGYSCHALSFEYGQQHVGELDSSKELARHYDLPQHKIVPLSFTDLLTSALTDPDIELPAGRDPDDMQDIPASYVPARNTIMLSIAVAYAEVIEADAIFIGVNALDYSGYPDCRPEYIEAFQRMANLATKRAVEGKLITIETPLLHLTKAQIIKKGLELGVPYQHTWSCYQGGERACRVCDSCVLRLKGFSEAGVEDPVEYE